MAKPSLTPHMQPILLAVGFALLVSISVATVWMVRQSAADSRLVARTFNIQNALSTLLLSVRRAESAQRGYLFTNDTSYLDDYKGATPETAQIVAELRALTQGDLPAQEAIDRMSAEIKSKFDEMNQTVQLNESGSREQARSLVMTGNGRDSMNSIRSLADKLSQDESRVLAQRTEQSQNNNQLLLVITLMGAVLIVGIGGLVVFLVRRTVGQREDALAELASTNANLERIVNHRTADLTEANEEIQRFAYIVTHDLRTPLVNIMGFTTELEQLRKDIFAQIANLQSQLSRLNAEAAESGENVEALGKDFDEAVSFIKTSIAKMDRLINAVLKLSREGRRGFHPESIDMMEMLNSISSTMAHRVSQQGAAIVVGELPPIVSDRLAIEQVFSNLVDNALKYTREDRAVRVEIEGRSTDTHLVYEVRDNGRGIDPRDHQRVFELFRRSGQQDRPGEGIGLAHVRALVRRLGGQLKLSSDIGKGSVFTVSLPQVWLGENRSAA